MTEKELELRHWLNRAFYADKKARALELLVEKAQAQKNEAVFISAEIQNVISTLHDDDLEAVLIHRYLLFETIEQSAVSMNYDSSTIKRKTKLAINKLNQNDLECTNSFVV